MEGERKTGRETRRECEWGETFRQTVESGFEGDDCKSNLSDL